MRCVDLSLSRVRASRVACVTPVFVGSGAVSREAPLAGRASVRIAIYAKLVCEMVYRFNKAERPVGKMYLA
jgi:hypothetical protein